MSAVYTIFFTFFESPVDRWHLFCNTQFTWGIFMGNQARGLAMAQWDVFTSKPLEGNSLAVFFDARELSDAQMQSIAKAMNLSETTFIFPRDQATERGVRVRIFTVQEELPFAGHPTLGTAFALRAESGAKESRST
jgi:PhzF family phenazine biosynthesis protein